MSVNQLVDIPATYEARADELLAVLRRQLLDHAEFLATTHGHQTIDRDDVDLALFELLGFRSDGKHQLGPRLQARLRIQTLIDITHGGGVW